MNARMWIDADKQNETFQLCWKVKILFIKVIRIINYRSRIQKKEQGQDGFIEKAFFLKGNFFKAFFLIQGHFHCTLPNMTKKIVHCIF